MSFNEELLNSLRANLPILWIESFEEDRVERTIKTTLKTDDTYSQYELFRWTPTDGLTNLDIYGVIEGERDKKYAQFPMLFEYMKDNINRKSIFLMHVQKEVVNDYRFIRYLRDIKEYALNEIKIILISTGINVPNDMEKLVYKINFDLLDKKKIMFLIKVIAQNKKNDITNSINDLKEEEALSRDSEIPLDNSKSIRELESIDFSYLTDDYIEKLAVAASGLTAREIMSIFELSFQKEKKFVKSYIMKQKVAQVEKIGVLEFVEPKVNFDDIGGNKAFKEWIDEIKYTIDPKAKDFGVEPAKGHLALGVPGTSKTYSAEALAGELGIPLLKLSSDKIFSSLVGESEKKIARAFEVAQACAPCILLIDEIEKTLSGTGSSNNTDAGTTARVFATVLENLNDPKGVYTVMTSNDITQLPPELTRIGRVDALWYFSLPNDEERKEILKIHLNKKDIVLDDYLLDLSIKATKNFTGAEIEQFVKNIKRKSYVNSIKNNVEMVYDRSMIESSISEINCLYEVSKEKIMILENMMKGRVRNASGETEKENKDKINKNLEEMLL